MAYFLHADIKILDQWALAVISRVSEHLVFVSARFAKTSSEHFFSSCCHSLAMICELKTEIGCETKFQLWSVLTGDYMETVSSGQ